MVAYGDDPRRVCVSTLNDVVRDALKRAGAEYTRFVKPLRDRALAARIELDRRAFLQSGLGVFAALVAPKTLVGCTPRPASGLDATARDASTPRDEAPARDASVDDRAVGDGAPGLDARDASDAFDATDASAERDVTDGAALADGSPGPDAHDAHDVYDAGGWESDAGDEGSRIEASALDEDFLPPRAVPPRPVLRSRIAEVGSLGPADENGVRVPPGFRARVLARSGERVAGTVYPWHYAPDGGATFATEDGGWIYVSNSEAYGDAGGVSALRFSSTAELRAAYPILARTNGNCSGGPTPWHSWLSCEEMEQGLVYECDPWGERPAIARPALGVFRHEAAAVDLERGHVYLTEDQPDGRLYRFVSPRRTRRGAPVLTEGVLQVAVVGPSSMVTWVDVPDPQFRGLVATRHQVEASTVFDGGEGAWFHEGTVFFSTKGNDRIWAYDTRTGLLRVIYDARAREAPPLRGVDNITVTCCGDVLVSEDQGSMQVVAILPSGECRVLVQVLGQDTSEITGPAFDPSGTRLYFSSQRTPGTTYEITGPFHAEVRL